LNLCAQTEYAPTGHSVKCIADGRHYMNTSHVDGPPSCVCWSSQICKSYRGSLGRRALSFLVTDCYYYYLLNTPGWKIRLFRDSSMNETTDASMFNGSKPWPYRHKYVTLASLSSQKQWQLITNIRLNQTSLDLCIFVLNNAILYLNLINTCITKRQ